MLVKKKFTKNTVLFLRCVVAQKKTEHDMVEQVPLKQKKRVNKPTHQSNVPLS